MSLGVESLAKSRSKNRRSKKPRFIDKILKTGMFILAVLVITYLLSVFVVQRMKVHSTSMMPTLLSEDSILIDKISYRFREPQRYEIIIFKQKITGDELIKRVIALPGETVRITDGKILIDGEEIEDVEETEPPLYPGLAAGEIKLHSGEYFVLGDNRTDSIDSRYEEVGIVTDTRIIGRLWMRILPLSDFKVF